LPAVIEQLLGLTDSRSSAQEHLVHFLGGGVVLKVIRL